MDNRLEKLQEELDRINEEYEVSHGEIKQRILTRIIELEDEITTLSGS